MEAIITTATIMAMYFNVATSNGGNYCYNADVENNKVMNIEVLNKEGKYLSQKLQYRFTYDDQNRLASKEALKWNADKQRWESYYVLDLAYVDGGYTLERHNWNATTHAYDVASEKMEYQMLGENVMAVNHYKMAKDNKGYELASNVLVMNPQMDNLLADLETEK
jgi:hypothetical protein